MKMEIVISKKLLKFKYSIRFEISAEFYPFSIYNMLKSDKIDRVAKIWVWRANQRQKWRKPRADGDVMDDAARAGGGSGEDGGARSEKKIRWWRRRWWWRRRRRRWWTDCSTRACSKCFALGSKLKTLIFFILSQCRVSSLNRTGPETCLMDFLDLLPETCLMSLSRFTSYLLLSPTST